MHRTLPNESHFDLSVIAHSRRNIRYSIQQVFSAELKYRSLMFAFPIDRALAFLPDVRNGVL